MRTTPARRPAAHRRPTRKRRMTAPPRCVAAASRAGSLPAGPVRILGRILVERIRTIRTRESAAQLVASAADRPPGGPAEAEPLSTRMRLCTSRTPLASATRSSARCFIRRSGTLPVRVTSPFSTMTRISLASMMIVVGEPRDHVVDDAVVRPLVAPRARDRGAHLHEGPAIHDLRRDARRTANRRGHARSVRVRPGFRRSRPGPDGRSSSRRRRGLRPMRGW